MKCSTRTTADLAVHPAVKHLPMLAETSEEAQAILESIRSIGIQEPLKTLHDNVVDGRHRLRAALALGLQSVPCIEIEAEHLHALVLHSLMARRHFTKSALAFLGVPLMESAIKERLLQTGLKERSARRALSAAVTSAETFGVCRRLVFSAQQVWKLFKKNPIYKDRYEGPILNGEVSLAVVLQKIARERPAKTAREPMRFWNKRIQGLCDARTFSGWDKAPEEVKAHVRAELQRSIRDTWPNDLVESVFKAI